MVVFDITARYTSFEAFVFDFVMAPAVFQAALPFRDAVLEATREGDRILDVGSGGGQLALDLKTKKESLRLTGVDLSSSQVDRARRRGAKARAHVSFLQASALDLPFADGSFDLVYSVDCLKHWPDRARGLRECVRVIRPGGTLLLTEIDRETTLRNGLRFARTWKFPSLLKPLCFVPFFLFAVLRSLTMEEARALAAPLALQDAAVAPGPGGVNWTLRATKPLASGQALTP